MIKVGVTGGIGSGKSTVCEIFKRVGVAVYDSDRRAKILMNNDPELREGIVNVFGSDAYLCGELNRRYIANLAFTDRDKLNKLNSMVHPAVQNDFCSWAERQKGHYVIEESALLFESQAHKLMDVVVAVCAPQILRIKRTMVRDCVSEQSVRDRIANQMSNEELERMADYVIIADDCHLVIPQVMALHKKLLQL